MIRTQIIFSGRVQGVGFRATARDTAAPHPVTGWVRNEPDGTVCLQAQGDPEAVDAFLRDLDRRVGRLVTGRDAQSIPVAAGETGFQIRR